MSHIVIVGDGAVGRATAYYAARRGHRVTIVERNREDHDGCSFGNAGMLTPSHLVPLAAPGMIAKGLRWMLNPEGPFRIAPRLDPKLIRWGWKFHRAATSKRVDRAAPLLGKLLLASRTLFVEIVRETGNEPCLVESGILMLCNSDAALEGERHEAARARSLGIDAEELGAGDVQKLEPDVRLAVVGGMLYPGDAIFVPSKFMGALGKLIDAPGVERQFSTEITGWRCEGTRIVAARTQGGDLAGDEFVICGGSWSPGIADGLGLRIPIEPGRGYSLTLANPRTLPKRGLILVEGRVAVTPMGSSLRIGGTMEMAGLDERISDARVRGIVKSAIRYMPDFSPRDFEGVIPWCGLRPVSPDGLPYVGRSSSRANLWVAAGHAMLGMGLAPITGALMAEMMSGEPPSIGIELLSPDRYA